MLSKCLASLVISATKAMVFLSQKLEPGLLGTSIARQVVVASAVLCLVSCCLFERGPKNRRTDWHQARTGRVVDGSVGWFVPFRRT